MTFKRQISYYLFTIYFPTTIIVISSWMSLWLDHKSVRRTKKEYSQQHCNVNSPMTVIHVSAKGARTMEIVVTQ